MSIRVMSAVWKRSKAAGSELLMLLAIADHADDDGKAFPGTTSLAKKTRTTPRNVRNLTKALEELGELRIEYGGGRFSNTYYVLIPEACCRGEGQFSGEEKGPGNQPSGQPGSLLQGTPETAISGESSYSRHESPEKAPEVAGKPKRKSRPKKEEVTIDAFIASCKERGEKVFRDDDSVYDFADKDGIERE